LSRQLQIGIGIATDDPGGLFTGGQQKLGANDRLDDRITHANELIWNSGTQEETNNTHEPAGTFIHGSSYLRAGPGKATNLFVQKPAKAKELTAVLKADIAWGRSRQ
jgi:hypothetical protein